MCNCICRCAEGRRAISQANSPRLSCFSADQLAMDIWEKFYISLNCIHKTQLKVLGAQAKKILNSGRFLLCFSIWKQDYRYVGIDERVMLGLILKKFSGYFCCYSGHCKGCCGVSCSSVAAQTTVQFQKWKGKWHSAFLLLLKSMVLSNCCYLGDEWLQFSRSSSNLLIPILGRTTQQLLLSDKDVPLDL